MALLFGRLQAQGAYFYWPEQLLSLHGYEESKFQISPLGPGAFLILFSNWLPPRQSKCSCKYFVKVFKEKPGWEK